MLGDSVWDVEAAKRAGIATVGVLTGGYSEDELRDAGAAEVFESIGELRERPEALRESHKMSANETRRTKIVATVGPASREPETLRELIDAGVDVFRLNFSHGNAADHAENVQRIRAASAELGRRDRDPRRPARARSCASETWAATSRCCTRARPS